MANLCEPGETILIINTGIWGVRAAELSRRYGGAWLPVMDTTTLRECNSACCHQNILAAASTRQTQGCDAVRL